MVKKIFNKIINIIKGWWYNLFNENEELAITRISICNQCEHREHIEMLGDTCGKCGCVLAAKARVKDEKCVLNKW